jgi:hypothetical protein
MFGLPPKADIVQNDCHVRFVPKADSRTAAKTVSPRPNSGVVHTASLD